MSVPAPDLVVRGFGRLTRDSLEYATGSVAGKLIAFLMLPVMTRLLTPTQYGQADLLTTLGSAAISFLLFGLDVAATRLAVDPAPRFPAKQIYGAWFAMSSIVIVLPSLALVAFAKPIGEQLFGPGFGPLPVSLVGAMTIAGTYQFMALAMLRADRRPRPYALVTGGTLALNAILTIGLLTLWRQDASAVLLAISVSLAAWAGIGFALLGRSRVGRPSTASMKALVTLGLPLAPAVALTWVGEFANRLILLAESNAAEVAYLGIGIRIASIAGLVVIGFQLGWMPHAYALGATEAGIRRTSQDARRILILASTGVAVFAVFCPGLLALLGGSAYLNALPAVGMSLLAVLGSALYLVTSMPSALLHRTGVLGASMAGGVLATIAANLLLASTFGGAGTALALALGQLAAAATAARLAPTSGRLSIPWRNVLVVIAFACACVCVSTLPTLNLTEPARIIVLAAFVASAFMEGTLKDLVSIGRDWLRSLI